MSKLDDVVKSKLAAAAEEKSSKQSGRFRLVADATISVAQIQEVLTRHVHLKQEKQFWALICPPPSGPLSYGWHSKPEPEWLMKVASLLYDLLEICPNTKLHSKKVVAALKAMQQNHDVFFPETKHATALDMMDKVDVTLRVLLSMLRQLKCSHVASKRTYKMLSKIEQCKLTALLDRVILPPQLLAGESFDEEEEKSGADICMSAFEGCEPKTSIPATCGLTALVPVEKQEQKVARSKPNKVSATPSGGSRLMNPLPTIFGKLLAQDNVVPAGASVVQPMKPATNVLALAMQHTPKAALKDKKPKQSKKSDKVDKKTSKKNPKKGKVAKGSSKKKSVKGCIAKSTKKENVEIVPLESLQYKPGEMNAQRDRFVQEQVNHGGLSKRDAMKTWATSLRRAQLLKDLSLSELIKRRFIPSGSKTNPFAEQVRLSLEAPNVD